MKCDLCDKPAVVHEVRVKNGVKRESHLCEAHASAKGISLPGQPPFNQFLTKLVVGNEERASRTARLRCTTCGTSFSAFRRSGLLGCPGCYDAFEETLAPMIERAQNGGSSHIGKCPARGGQSIDRQLRRQRLSQELEEAVAAEEYERAAKLRDRLRELDPMAVRPRRDG